jgi:histidyl-tRNA synthetase
VYVVHSGSGTAALGFTAAERLRDAGLNVVLHAGGGSFKSQFKRADASGAHLAVVIGEDEAASGQLAVKHLRNRNAQQQTSGIEDLPELVSNFMNEE